MISINDKANCTGCGACYSICPKKAITLKEDFSGFKYPTVNVDKCVNCNLCEKVCPEINTVCTDNSYAEPIVKAAWNLDNDIRVKSTSGGVFSAIAEKFISNGGYIVAAEFVENFRIQHTIISDKKDINKLRQTKYAQSELSDLFVKIKKLLYEDNYVMFVGTPLSGHYHTPHRNIYLYSLKPHYKRPMPHRLMCLFFYLQSRYSRQHMPFAEYSHLTH